MLTGNKFGSEIALTGITIPRLDLPIYCMLDTFPAIFPLNILLKFCLYLPYKYINILLCTPLSPAITPAFNMILKNPFHMSFISVLNMSLNIPCFQYFVQYVNEHALDQFLHHYTEYSLERNNFSLSPFPFGVCWDRESEICLYVCVYVVLLLSPHPPLVLPV